MAGLKKILTFSIKICFFSVICVGFLFKFHSECMDDVAGLHLKGYKVAFCNGNGENCLFNIHNVTSFKGSKSTFIILSSGADLVRLYLAEFVWEPRNMTSRERLILYYLQCDVIGNYRFCYALCGSPTHRWFHRPVKERKVNNVFCLLLLLISGVEPNPGPNWPLHMGVLNGRSIQHKGALVQDLINDHEFDILAISESWIPSDAPDIIKHGSVPAGYRISHVHRGDHTMTGGGLCIIYRDDLKVNVPSQESHFGSFECQTVTFTNVRPPLTIANIYRPSTSSVPVEFSDELGTRIDTLLGSCKKLVVCGDFNCPWAPGEETNPAVADLMLSFNLRQHVTSSTHTDGNLLDLIFDQESDDDFKTAVKVSPVAFSDHYLIETDLSVIKGKKPLLKFKKRRLNKLDLEI